MNALVKKEIRLLLPSWAIAMLLALPPVCTRSDDGFPIALLLFGMALMALTSIGRETSLNTFSQMLAQPAERLRIWQTKLTVLVIAFLAVFAVWRLATIFSFHDYGGSPADADDTEAVLVAGCLAAVATFSGGLWATLLLRQIAGAFWLTLLVPAILAGFTAAFLSQSQSGGGVIAALCIIIGVYSIGGFVFARWLFFRAQDIGWTGGIIDLPQLNYFTSRSESLGSMRKLRPIAAMFKKEIQLHQVSLMGAAALLVLHIGVLVLRANHKFPRESAGEILTIVFWMFWLVLPVMVGAMAIAEERRLGVMEGQLCLPASRRLQFAIKAGLALFLGIFLGGVMPCALEMIGSGVDGIKAGIGQNSGMLLAIVGLAAWLSLVSFFGSSMAKNFLQAIGFAIATFMLSSLIFPAFASGRMVFFDSLPQQCLLPLVIAVPTLLVTLLCLAYLNYKNFRDGWHLWRRSVLVALGVMFLASISSSAIYNRAWEIVQPAEPSHGIAKLTLANPPELRVEGYQDNLLVRLPDGRVWFDFLTFGYEGPAAQGHWTEFWQTLFPPLPKSGGPQRFLSGSNWVSATAQHIDIWTDVHELDPKSGIHILGYTESFGIQPDGTLWVSEKSDQNRWTADKLTRFGNESDWKQAASADRISSVLLLKKDGTLWQWGRGTNRYDWTHWPQNWPGLSAFQPKQIGTDSDWKEFYGSIGSMVRKNDGTVWGLWNSWNGEKTHQNRYDQIPWKKSVPFRERQWGAFVHDDGTLWLYGDLHFHNHNDFETLQSGRDSDWVVVATTYDWMVALKNDGTLWQWNSHQRVAAQAFTIPPSRLGIHNDWVALAGIQDGVVTLAADGSLWYWPYRGDYRFNEALLRLPKQPRFLGNVLGQTD